jgi:hypothetical protein
MLLRIGRLAEDEPLTADVSKLLPEVKLSNRAHGSRKDLPDGSAGQSRRARFPQFGGLR